MCSSSASLSLPKQTRRPAVIPGVRQEEGPALQMVRARTTARRAGNSTRWTRTTCATSSSEAIENEIEPDAWERCRAARRPSRRSCRRSSTLGGAHEGNDIAEGHFEASQDIEITSVLAPKKRPPNPSRFKFEKVNEVTWKLTNGEMTNVPAQIGFWGGYRVTEAIAWVINVAPNAWLARRGDQTSNAFPLHEAKSAAMAMAKGAPGDYRVKDSIAHLNGLQARLFDGAAAGVLTNEEAERLARGNS